MLVGGDLCHVDEGDRDCQGAANLSQKETKDKDIPIPAQQTK
jgi:hypothetical protein